MACSLLSLCIFLFFNIGIFANSTCVLGEPDGTFPGTSELGDIDGDIEVEMAGDKALGLSEL